LLPSICPSLSCPATVLIPMSLCLPASVPSVFLSILIFLFSYKETISCKTTARPFLCRHRSRHCSFALQHDLVCLHSYADLHRCEDHWWTDLFLPPACQQQCSFFHLLC